MHHFTYKNGTLHAEDVALNEIVEAIGTPFYCYSTATLERHLSVFQDAFSDVDSLVCFAVKANSNVAVLRTLGDMGAGADIVSVGEMQRALDAGIPANKLIFSGVAKEDHEIEAALTHGILQFNVESDAELDAISRVATRMGKTAPIAIRINPHVVAETHEKISTGKKGDKFGIDWQHAPEIYKRAASLPGIAVRGIAVHIGSQITDLAPFEQAFTRVGEMLSDLRAAGHDIHQVDLGGGLGIPYEEGNDLPPVPDEYAAMVKRVTQDWGVRLVFEPGRMIAGNAGIMVSKVRFIKQAGEKTYAMVDSAMNDLVRPSLYDGHHHVLPVAERTSEDATQVYDLVGPICETGDVLAKNRKLPTLKEEELVAFMSAGAYGAVMSSTYNSRPLIPEVLVNGDQFAVVRRRQTYEDMLSLEQSAPWLNT